MREHFEVVGMILIIISPIIALIGLVYLIIYLDCNSWRNITELETKFDVGLCYSKVNNEWSSTKKIVKVYRDGKLVWEIDRQ